MRTFLFGFALFGYGVISFLVNESSSSRTVTVPYRVAVLLGSFLVILSSLNTKKLNSYKKPLISDVTSLSQLILLCLSIFICIYSIRLVLDVIKLDKFLIRPANEYLLNWFGICLLPGLSFLFIRSKESERYLYCSWLFLLITSLLALLINKQESVVFLQQGRLSGIAFNPIAVSQYGVSLVLLSTFMFFTKSKTSLNIYFNFIYFSTIFLGFFITFLGSARGPTLALILCIVILLIGASKNSVSSSKILGIVSIGFTGLVILSYLAVRLGSSYLDRILGIFNQGSSLTSIDPLRSEFLQKSSTFIWDNFMFGYSLELPDAGYPHNLVVEAFLSTGFLGGLFFALIYFYSIIKAIFLIMNDWHQWGWLGLIYIQYAISAMSSGALYSSYTFWYLLFAVLSRKSLGQSYEAKQSLPNLANT